MEKKSLSAIRTAVGLALANLCLAAWVVGPRVYDPGNTDWMRGDVVQNAFAWAAYRAEPGLGLTTQSLSWPLAIDLALFDFMPIVAWAFKLINSLLPLSFQYFGPLMLLNSGLQGFFAFLLLWSYVGRQISGWGASVRATLGALLIAASPVLYERLGYSAPILTCHWIILLALWLYVRSDQESVPKSLALFSLLLALVAGFNPYLLVMVSLVYLALLSRFTLEKRWSRWTVLTSPLPLLIALAMLIVFGFIQLGGEGVIPGVGYGYYSSPMNALFNPMHDLVGSTLMPPLPLDVAGQYEGYAYLGVGGIALTMIGLGLARSRGMLYGTVEVPLLILAGMAYFAALPFALVFTIPEPLFSVLAVFRSSGRFMWLTHYILLALGAGFVIRLWPARVTTVVLALCVGLQVTDLAAPYANLRSRFAQMKAARFTDQMYKDLGSVHSLLLVMPPWQCWTFKEEEYSWEKSEPIALLAIDNHLKTNSFYAGRLPVAQERYHCQENAGRLLPAPPDLRTAYLFLPLAFARFGQTAPNARFCDTDGLFVLCREDREPGISDRLHALLQRIEGGPLSGKTPSR